MLEASKYYNCKYDDVLEKINYYEIEDCFNSFNIYIVFKDEENQFIGDCIDIAKHFDLDKKRLRGYIKRYGKKNKDVTEAVLKCNKWEIDKGIKEKREREKLEKQIIKKEEELKTKINYIKFLNKEFEENQKFMYNGQKCKIIDLRNDKDIDVEFEDGTIVRNKLVKDFLYGEIANPNLRLNGISNNEIICQYYFDKIGFNKVYSNVLKKIDKNFGRMEFDLYKEINGNKVAIEYDGYITHTYEHDLKKNQLCIKNNIHLIRIREPQLEKYEFEGIKQFYLESNKIQSDNLQDIISKIIKYINLKYNQNFKTNICFEKDNKNLSKLKNYYLKEKYIGMKNINKNSEIIEIINYKNKNSVDVKINRNNSNNYIILNNIKYMDFKNGIVE